MVNRMSEIVREMTREEAIRKLQKQKAEYLEEWVDFSGVAEAYDMAIEALEQPERKNAKSDIVEVVRCKDCKHRPKRLEEGKGEGFNLEFPDYKCPCQCDDGWYNWMPDDNWFCGDAERKES